MLGIKRVKEVILQIYGNLKSKKSLSQKVFNTPGCHLRENNLGENQYYGIESLTEECMDTGISESLL